VTTTSPVITSTATGATIHQQDGEVTLTADTSVTTHSATVTSEGSGARLELGSSATLQSSSIALNSGSGSSPSSESESVQPTTIRLLDQDGEPVPRAPYVIVQGANRRRGNLNDDGEATLYLTGQAEVVFPDHPRAEA
jgi:hypothetical protein